MRPNRTKPKSSAAYTMHAHSHQLTETLKFVLSVATALTLLGLFLAVIHR